MPRFDEDGNIYAGVGGGSAYINGREIATNAGGTCPLVRGVGILQIGDRLYRCAVDGNPQLVTDDPFGANELAAGGGIYAAKFNGIVRISNRPETFPGYGVGDVGPDGWVLLLGPDGLFAGQYVRDLQSMGAGRWSGLDLHFRPVQSPDLLAPSIVNGEVYNYRRGARVCCYLAPTIGFVVQWLNRPVGKVLIPKTSGAWRPDILERADGTILVVVALTEGEIWSSVRVFAVRPEEMREDLMTTNGLVPDHAALARRVFESFPTQIAELRAKADETDALRRQFGPDDPRVLEGERVVNNLKGAFTRRIAWAVFQQDPQFGLRRKTTGAHAVRPSDGLLHATDVLMMRTNGQIVDVMSDRDVSWSWTNGDVQAIDQWVEPLKEDEVIDPDQDLKKRVVALEAKVAALQTQTADLQGHDAEQTAELIALRRDLDALRDDHTDLVRFVEHLSTRKLKVDGSTGRAFGHSHTIKLPVVEGE